MQITATPRKCILHAAESSQMPYTEKIEKTNNLNNKIKKSLRAPQ
jgi:hypothetical protein